MIEYTSSLEGIVTEQLAGFFEGWPNPPSTETHMRLLRGSAEVILAIDSRRGIVVGFITAISDSVLSAHIPLLEVRREWRGLGIGKELVKRMLDRLKHFYMVDLLCDPQIEPFYEIFDMKPATGMMIRNRKAIR